MVKTYYDVQGGYTQRLEVGTNRLLEEEFRNAAGELHRLGGLPARIRYASAGKHIGLPIIQEWYQDGELHREDGPAFIQVIPGLQVQVSEWKRYGSYNRCGDLPARTKVDLNTGRLLRAEFFLFHNRHRKRDRGPAILEFDRVKGDVTKFQFWELGKRIRTSRKLRPEGIPQHP